MKPRTMLVDEHAEGDTTDVETIQEILHIAADVRVETKLLLVLDHSLGHGRNHIIVSVPDLDKDV